MSLAIDFNMVSELLHQTKDHVDKMPTIRIMVVGKTGVGKSTLINNLFREKLATTGVGKPVTQYVQRLYKDGVPMVLYDTRGLELDENVREVIREELLETLTKNEKYQGEKIHLVYYCINSQINRIEDEEISLIKALAKYVPVIVVLTQSMGTSANEFKHFIEGIHLPIEGIYPVMAEPFPIYEDVTIPRWGLEDLIAASFESIPEENRIAFTNVQQIDISRKTKEARRWVKKYIYTTFGIGFAPIPFSDASLLVPMQITMMAHITAIFGVTMDQATLSAVLGAVGGTTGATFAGRYIVANLTKMLPGLGTIVGAVISGTTAASLTTALGYSYIEILALMAKGKDIDAKELGKVLSQKTKSRLKQHYSLSDRLKESRQRNDQDASNSISQTERIEEKEIREGKEDKAFHQAILDRAERLIKGESPQQHSSTKLFDRLKTGKRLAHQVVKMGAKWLKRHK